MKKLLWALVLLILVFLFRGKLWEMLPFQHESFSLIGLMTALVGGFVAFFIAYGMIVTLQFRAVWQVASIIVFSSVLSTGFGHWLGGFPVYGEFWGGFVNGAIETSVLWGALYGAKDVWKGKSEEG